MHENIQFTSKNATPWLLLIFLCSLGALLRYHNFWTSPLWVDEYVTWWIVAGDTWTEAIQRAQQATGQSTFYSLVVKAFTTALDINASSLRIPSLFFGSVILTIVYPLAMRIFDDRSVAISSAAIFALSEPLIFQSQNARPYSLALLLTLASFWCFLCLGQSMRGTVKVTYVLVTTLLIYTHLVFVLVLFIQALHLILTRHWREVMSKKYLLPAICIAIMCLPLAHQLARLYSIRHTINWTTHLGHSNIMAEFFLVLFNICHPWIFLPTLVALFATGFQRNDGHSPSRRAEFRLLWLWLTGPVVFFAATPLLLGITFFSPRYLLLTYPAAFFLLAWLLHKVKPIDWRRWIPTTVFMASSAMFILIPYVQFGAFSFGTRWDWASAVRTLNDSAAPTDLIIYRTGLLEADFFAESSPRGYLQSYVGWPIIANLPPNRSYQMISLPFRLGDHTQAYFAYVEERASHQDRLWVVGEGKLTEVFVQTMISKHRFNRLYHAVHGKVEVTLLKRRSDNSDAAVSS